MAGKPAGKKRAGTSPARANGNPPPNAAKSAPAKKAKKAEEPAAPAPVLAKIPVPGGAPKPKAKPAAEEDFPRGYAPRTSGDGAAEVVDLGGERDVLFGSKESKAKPKAGDKGKSKKDKKGKFVDADATPDTLPKIVEALKFKRLTIGTVLLGVVREITSTDVSIGLPDSLTGFVKLAEISEPLTELLAQAAARDESDAEDSDAAGSDEDEEGANERRPGKRRRQSGEEGPEVPKLADLLYPGQIVRCVVTGLSKEGTSRRVELSMRPGLVNAGLSLSSLHENMGVYGCVKTVEDHGYTISFGVPGFTGFLLNKHAKKLRRGGTASAGGEGLRLRVGQPVECAVLSVSAPTRTVSVTVDPDVVARATAKETDGIQLQTLKAGTLVSAHVAKVLPNGLVLRFLGSFHATADLTHLATPALSEASIASHYSLDQKVKARLLYVDPHGKLVGASLRGALVRMEPCTLPHDLQVGTVIEAAIVRRVDPSVGLLMEVPRPAAGEGEPAVAHGYVHISRASDGHVEKLEKAFKPGSRHRARVVSHSAIDGLLGLSLQKSVIEAPILRLADCVPGMLVKGKVADVKESGVIVTIADHVRGLIPKMHLGDVRIKHPEKKFKVGADVTVRVLTVSPAERKLLLTHKRTLVESDLPIIASKQQAAAGAVAHGFVTAVRPYGCIVTFFGGVHGLVPLAELGITTRELQAQRRKRAAERAAAEGGESEEEGAPEEAAEEEAEAQPIAECFAVGQVVKVRVVQHGNDRLKLSFVIKGVGPQTSAATKAAAKASAKAPAAPGAKAAGAAGALEVGAVVRGTVKAAQAGSLTVEIGPGVEGTLPDAHLTDHGANAALVHDRLAPGTEIDEVLVLTLEAGKAGRTLLTLKPSLIAAARAGELPKAFDELAAGAVLQGYVKNVTPFGVFVGFLGDLTGLAPKGRLRDGFVSDPAEEYSLGQSVRALVEATDPATRKATLSLKQTACASSLDDPAFLRSLFADFDGPSALPEWLRIGACVDADVTMVKDYGVICALPDDFTGFVHAAHAKPDKGAAAPKAKARVRGRILDVNAAKSIVDLSLRPALVSAGDAAPSGSGAAAAEGKDKGKKRKKGAAAGPGGLAPGEDVDCIVELTKDDYLVVSIPSKESAIAYAAFNDFNLTVPNPHDRFKQGRKVKARVAACEPGGRALLRVAPESLAGNAPEGSKKKLELRPGEEAKYLNESVRRVLDVQPGMLVKAKVVGAAKDGSHLRMSLGLHLPARLDVTEVEDGPLGKVAEACGPVAGPSSAGEARGGKRKGKALAAEAAAAPASSSSSSSSSNPLARFRPNDVVECKVLNVRTVEEGGDDEEGGEQGGGAGKGKRKRRFMRHVIELTARPAELGAGEGAAPGARLTFETAKKGARVRGVVLNADKDSLWVQLSPYVKARAFVCDAAATEEAVADPSSAFPRGTRVVARILSVDAERERMDVALKEGATSGELKAGAELLGRVSKHLPDATGLMVQVGPHAFGRVHITDVPDDVTAGAESAAEAVKERYPEGAAVRCWVLSVDETGRRIDLSLAGDRPASSSSSSKHKGEASGSGHGGTGILNEDGSLTDVEGIDQLQAGMKVRACVRNTEENKGCFVSIGRKVVARALISQLSDVFIRDVKGAFPAGKIVNGRILSVDRERQRVEVSLKKSVVDRKEGEGRLSFDQLKPGLVVRGKVKKTESYGVFVRINKSDLSGLAHVSEISDDFVKNVGELYKAGDAVRAIVLKADPATRRISLGLKTSYFKDIPDEEGAGSGDDDEDEEAEAEGGEEEAAAGEPAKRSRRGGKKAAEEEEEAEEEDDDRPVQDAPEEEAEDEEEAAEGEGEEDGLDFIEEGASDEDEDEDEEEDEEEEEGKPALDLGGGVSWSGGAAPKAADKASRKAKKGAAPEPEEPKSEADAKKEEKKKRREAKRALEEEERHIREREQAIVEGAAPQSADDFERLVMGSPGSSYVWIAYMAHKISLTEIEEARGVAERALKTIPYREEGEKMNVWVALLNLEHKYGSEATLQSAFQRAAQTMDPKKMHVHLLNIYERAGEADNAEELYQVMTRKFKQSRKVWLRYLQAKMRQGKHEAARKTLQRALECLPKRKHIRTITRFAQLEFKHGSAERGRTIFDGILRTYPKRVDLWSIFLDMEIKGGDAGATRRLFERVATLNLSSKKMKFFFSKWLEFERQVGTPATQEHVRAAARAWVESKMK